MTDFLSLNLKSNWLDCLKDELTSFGFADFYYTCFYHNRLTGQTFPKNINKRVNYQYQSPSHALTMKYCSSGNRTYLRLHEKFFKIGAEVFPGYYREPSWELEVFKETITNKKLQNMDEAFKEFGFLSSAIFEVSSPTHGNIIGMFLLSSFLPTEELKFQVEKNRLVIEQALRKYNERLLSENINNLNPWVNTGVLSDRSAKILQLLCEGMRPTDIASELFLTRRGIDYHIDALKIKLDANNMNSLISKVTALNMVDTTRLFKKNY